MNVTKTWRAQPNGLELVTTARVGGEVFEARAFIDMREYRNIPNCVFIERALEKKIMAAIRERLFS